MAQRLKVLFIFMMLFPPIFMAVLIWFSPQFQNLSHSTKVLSYSISVVFSELILLLVYFYIRKRASDHTSLDSSNQGSNENKKYWWVYLLTMIGMAAFIYYLVSYQYSLYNLVGLPLPVIFGAYFIIKKPVSVSGIFSRKFEYILGILLLITGVLRIISEVLM